MSLKRLNEPEGNHESTCVTKKIISGRRINSKLRVEILDKYQTSQEITEIVEKVLIDLREKKIFSELDGWRNEHYSVKERFSDDHPVFTIERSAASLFGIKCYGCHINGYLKRDNQYLLWIARRSRNKETYPGMLDNFVRPKSF